VTSDRGYTKMHRLLETAHPASGGEVIAAAIRERDLAKMRNLLGVDGLISRFTGQ
jgi:hypothetical protein